MRGDAQSGLPDRISNPEGTSGSGSTDRPRPARAHRFAEPGVLKKWVARARPGSTEIDAQPARELGFETAISLPVGDHGPRGRRGPSVIRSALLATMRASSSAPLITASRGAHASCGPRARLPGRPRRRSTRAWSRSACGCPPARRSNTPRASARADTGTRRPPISGQPPHDPAAISSGMPRSGSRHTSRSSFRFRQRCRRDPCSGRTTTWSCTSRHSRDRSRRRALGFPRKCQAASRGRRRTYRSGRGNGRSRASRRSIWRHSARPCPCSSRARCRW